jgi:very-short-patch-repair endonuclease
MDDALRTLAARQMDVVAHWQLLDAGATPGMIRHRVRRHGWHVVHDGVYALTQAPLTNGQRWIAATLTTPDTYLSHGSAAARYGIRRMTSVRLQTVVRPGNGGPRRIGTLWVTRSLTLEGDTTVHQGVRMTTPERTVVDLAAGTDVKATRRLMREALRLRLTKPLRLVATATRHRTQRNALLIAETAARYASLPYGRTRSDAEALALELLHDAGVEPPHVNRRIAGEEADLSWPARRLIIEIDGPQFHRFADEDARKQGIWEGAGFRVRRIPSDAVHDEPARLIVLATRQSRMRPSA